MALKSDAQGFLIGELIAMLEDMRSARQGSGARGAPREVATSAGRAAGGQRAPGATAPRARSLRRDRAPTSVAAPSAREGRARTAPTSAVAQDPRGGVRGWLQRIPVLGSLVDAGLAFGSALGVAHDPGKTPEENRARRYRGTGGAVGMGAGGVASGVLGSALGPVGSGAGAYLGAIVGERIGEKAGVWAKAMIDADIPGQIVASWQTTSSLIGRSWKSLAEEAGALPSAANRWLRKASGVDLGKSVSNVLGPAARWAGEKIGQAGDFVRDHAGALVPRTLQSPVAAASAAVAQSQASSKAKAQTKTQAKAKTKTDSTSAPGKPKGASSPKPGRRAPAAPKPPRKWVLGQTSERYESGGRGAGTISSGTGDLGGVSYGTYQLSSKAGTLGEFLKATAYGKQFEGLTPGTAEFNAKWKETAKNDTQFGAAQHKFIEDTHYKPLMRSLQKAGIDLSVRGPAVQDVVWSTATQFRSIPVIQKALAGKDHAKMSDAEIITAVQDHKAANNETLFRKSSADIRAGTLNRAKNEKASLLALNATHTANLPPPAAAGVPPSVPAQLPEPPKNQVPEQLNPGAAGGAKVSVDLHDKTTQNIPDRGIAHIVTGGIGGIGGAGN